VKPSIAFLLSFALVSCTASAPADAPRPSNAPVALVPDVPNVGIVVFDGLFITELTAPFDIYKHAGERLNVFSVGQTRDPIRSYYGIGLVPDFTFEDCPEIDVLVVPSGIHSVDSDLENAALVGFVRERAQRATWVTSHCWGAFTLARAGLLDGRQCMTFPSSIDQLESLFPGVESRKGRRFVVDGNIVTSGGGLAAFEAAVWVVEQMLGRELAEEISTGLVFADQNRRFALGAGVEGGTR
jgi:transcriptional regulator GlxA family with amidase domain